MININPNSILIEDNGEKEIKRISRNSIECLYVRFPPKLVFNTKYEPIGNETNKRMKVTTIRPE
jgi:hypothetical protein